MCPSWWWEASSSPSSWSALWWPSTAAPACGPSSRRSSPFASPCGAARAKPSPWSSPPPPRASAPLRDSPARPPPALARPEAAAPCGGFLSGVRGSSTAAWCLPPSPHQPPPPPRPLRLCLHLHLPRTHPHQRPCLEASSTPPPTPSYSSTSPLCPLTPLRAPGSSCRSSTSSPCSPTPSQQPRASPTSDRADRAPGMGNRGITRFLKGGTWAGEDKHTATQLVVFGWKAQAGWTDTGSATGARGIVQQVQQAGLRRFPLCITGHINRPVRGSNLCTFILHCKQTSLAYILFFIHAYDTD